MKRSIGIFGTTATLVGYIVGASIFILPGELAAAAGPAVVVAYLLAAVPAVLCCGVSAEIGCAFPVSGAAYVAVSRVIGPFWGFMMAWATLSTLLVGVPLVAYGLVDYLGLLIPNFEPAGGVRTMIALSALAFFWGVNAAGARLSVTAQSIMVVGFLAVLVMFGFGGMLAMDWNRLTPLFPNGFPPVALAAIPAYFSFIGFFAIIEIAEEIKRPAWTLPRAILIGFGIVLAVYASVSVALPGLIPWEELATTPAPVGVAAARFLPAPLALLVSLGALLAIATSINAIFLAHARDVYALARDRIFPDSLGRLAADGQTPARAVLFVAVVSAVGVLFGATITRYATLAVLGVMIIQILMALVILRLPRWKENRLEEVQQGSEETSEADSPGFRMGPVMRHLVAAALILYSVGFLLLGIMDSPAASLGFVGLIVAGTIYYGARRRQLLAQGVRIDDALRDLTNSEASR